jgi:hypothetical protein
MTDRAAPKIGRRNRWSEWEAFCLQCLRLALKRLRKKTSLPEGENALNAYLFDELRRAARELCPEGYAYPPIRAECPVQPHGISDESHRRLKATPDITWGYEDDAEPDPLRATRDFVIECKRVRSPTGAGWVFTKHYADDGMNRFIDPAKRYAEGVGSAIVVGYWQDSSASALHSEVTTAATLLGFPVFSRKSKAWKARGVTELDHVFDRPFSVSPFRLHHFWVDLRIEAQPKNVRSR